MAFFILFVLFSGTCGAQGLGTLVTQNGLYYRIISQSPNRLGLVHPVNGSHYTGSVVIPDTVVYAGQSYRVTQLLDSAFFGCSGVTSITIPATIDTIGLFVFQNVATQDSLELICEGEDPPYLFSNATYTFYGLYGPAGIADLNRWRNKIHLKVPCTGFRSYGTTPGWLEVLNLVGEYVWAHYYDTVCKGTTYDLHNFYVPNPIADMEQNGSQPEGWGCIYNATLHLKILPTYENYYNYYYCGNEYSYHSYHANGFDINNYYGPGYWTNYDTTVNGCDSISHLTFSKMSSSLNEGQSICQNDEFNYTFRGMTSFHLNSYETGHGDTTINITKNFTPTNDATNTYQEGCQQSITINLHIYPVVQDTLTASICQGSTFTWNYTGFLANSWGGYSQHTNTHTYTEAGLYCDSSMVTNIGCGNRGYLNLSVNPPSDTLLYRNICGNEAFNINSQDFSVPGLYETHFSNRYGCDSTVRVNLSVNPAYANPNPASTHATIYHSDFNSTDDINRWNVQTNSSNTWRVRDGALRVSESATSNNFNRYSTTNSTATYTFNTGVYDSIEILFPYVVNGESTDYLRIFVNNTGDPNYYASGSLYYVGNGQFAYRYAVATPNRTQTLKLQWINNSNGRGTNPPVYIDELTVNGIKSGYYNYPYTSISGDICSLDTFRVGGFSHTATGTYLDTLSRVTNGCDSILHVTLSVHQPYDIRIDTSLCNGSSLSFDGNSYTTSAQVTDSLRDVYGCDSVRHLDLTVWPTSTETDSVTHLGDDPYLFGGRYLTTSGTYYDTLSTHHGCDSVIILNLRIHPNAYTTFDESICDNETYTLHGFNENETGTYVDSLLTVWGADSIVTLHLTVHPTYNLNLNEYICQGESYTFNSHLMETTGQITDLLHSVYGCDSVVTMHLTVHPVYSTTIDTTIYGDDPFVFLGESFSTSGTYTRTLHTQYGCDSTFALNLTIHNNADTVIRASICNHQTYSDNGFNESATGTYTRHISTTAGADSAITLILTVNPVYDDTVPATICDRTSYSFGGNDYSVAGLYTDSLLTYRGCDSVMTLALTVRRVDETTRYDTVRGDQGFWFYGTHYDSTGVYTDTLPNVYGCDSITHEHLQIYPTKTQHIYDTICQTQTYSRYDFVGLTATGQYIRNGLFTVVGHSDSTAVLHLQVNPVYDDTVPATICDRTSYSFGGNDYSVAGPYTDSLLTYRGCDSVMTLALTVRRVDETTRYDTVRGDQGFWFYGTHYDSTGVYTDTLPNVYGCDSITHEHLQIYPTKTQHIYDTICQTQTYSRYDFVGLTATGQYIRNGLFTIVGHSDSTAVLHLQVNPVYDDTLQHQICDRTVYSGFGNHTLSETGFTTDSLLTIRMCDSVVTMHLTVNPVYEVTVYDTVRGDDPYNFHGTPLDTTGIYCDTLPTINGCDSIVLLYLQIYNTETTHIYDTICNTQVYDNYGFHGQTAVGTYYQNLFTVAGADSTVILHLWVNPVYDDTLQHQICDRTVYYGFGNHALSETGYTTDSLLTYRMCDSVVTMHLTVNPVYEVPVYDTLRGDEPYDFYGTPVDTTGYYCDTLPTIAGCDSIIHLQLQVYKNAYTSLYDTICDRDIYEGYGFSQLTQAGTYVDSLYTFGGSDSVIFMHLWVNPVHEVDVYDTICSNMYLVHHGDTLTQAGNYTDTIPSRFGCDSIVTLHLAVLPSYDDSTFAEICDNQSYAFHFREHLTETGTYRHYMEARNGCDSILTLLLTVHPTYSDTIYDSILPTENYVFGSHILYDPGFYTDSLTSIHGCDSIVSIVLTNWYLHTTRLHDSICAFDSIFFNNEWLTEAGVYTDTLTAEDNSDSLVVLFLHVNPVYDDTVYDSIFCTQYYIFEGDSINTAGNYTRYHQSIYGCDSTVTLSLYIHITRDMDSVVCMDRLPMEWNGILFPDTLVTEPVIYHDTAIVWNDTAQRNILLAMHVTVIPNPVQTIADTIVENQLPYNFRNHIYSEATTSDTLLLPAVEGCDTTTYYSLFVYPNVTASADTVICYGQIPFVWNGLTFEAPEGVPSMSGTTTLVSHTGSDSLLSMNVTILQNSYVTRHDTIVENQLPYDVHGTIYFDACNLDTLVIPNAIGCDSVIYYRLCVRNNCVRMLDTSLCDYLMPLNWNDRIFNDDGTSDLLADTSTFHNVHGADSMVIMRVHILRCSSTVFDSTVCSAQLPLRWNGVSFNMPQDMPTTLVDTIALLTPSGADSLVILRLRVNESFNQTFYDTVCANHPYRFLGENYASSTTLSANLQTVAGCDSNVVVHLQVWPVENHMFQDVLCPGTTYIWINGESYTEPQFGPFSTLRTIHGCDSVVYLNLVPGEEAVARIETNKTWVETDDNAVRLVDITEHGESRIWFFPDSTSTNMLVNYEYPLDYDSVRIYLQATNHDGCRDTASVMLRLDRNFCWVPNAFTPEQDVNNRFIVGTKGLENVKVSIYTRAGQFVYSWEGVDGYWDGKVDGVVCPQAAYTYILTYTTKRNPNELHEKIGTVLLLR